MKKKIPIWLLLLVVIFGGIFTVAFGWSVKYVSDGGRKIGKLGSVVVMVATFPTLVKDVFFEIGITTDEKGKKKRHPLLIENRFPEIDGFNKNGVIQGGALEDDGYLFLSAYDTSKKQPVVKLIRIRDQKVIHEWAPNVQELIEIQKTDKSLSHDIDHSRARMVHPMLLDDGGIIFGFAGPVIKVNLNSDVVWSINRSFHHSIEQDIDGNFWIPSKIVPASYGEDDFPGYIDHAISKVSPGGELLFEKSVSIIMEENGYRGLLFGVGPYEPDPIHLNDIQPAHYSTKFWEKGDLLLSLRHRSTILLYRPSTNKIVWLKTGPWLNQHDADFIGESKISVFGNDVVRTPGSPLSPDGQNNVYLFDFSNASISSPYSHILKELGVRTPTQGRQEILENGNAFIEETDYGRILRVSPKEVIWEFTVKVDDATNVLVDWSRYLSKKKVEKILPLLEGSN